MKPQKRTGHQIRLRKLSRVVGLAVKLLTYKIVNIHRESKKNSTTLRSLQRDIALLKEVGMRLDTDGHGEYWMIGTGIRTSI
jgi:predicted DNA-binding transcriptional regulator YafY